jgi:uncharacterized protein (TIGR02271 family)
MSRVPPEPTNPDPETSHARGDGGEAAAHTLPLVEETAHIDRMQVDRGGYRISKRVRQHEQRVDAVLQEQRVDIERRAIGEWVSEMPPIREDGDTLIVPVVEEVLVTEKRLRLVEEVHIHRINETRSTSVPVTLRTETIEVERLPPQASTDSDQP